MQVTVSISDMKVSKNPRQVLITHSLGSCLGLAVFDPKAGVGGLIHCLLPYHTGNPRAESNPYMFVSSGIPAMIRRMYALGAKKESLVLKAAGCGRMLGVLNQFNTGARNTEALEKLLDKNGIKLAGSDMGGSMPRTMLLCLDTGRVLVRSRGKERVL